MASDLKKLKAEYIRSDISLRDLAKKHGVSFSTLGQTAAREKWTDLKKQVQDKAETKAIESSAEKRAKDIAKFDTIADLLMTKIYECITDGSVNLLNKQAWRDITGALKDLRDIKGLKSEADMQEQIARIEKLRKEAKEDNEQTKEIKVVIQDNLEDYSN